MPKKNNPQLVKQLRSNISSIRFSFIGLPIVAVIFAGSGLIVIPAFNMLMALLMAPFFFTLLICSIFGLANGRAAWWFFSAISFFSLLALAGMSMVLLGLNVTSPFIATALLVVILIPSIFSWRWGAERFNAETMEHVLASKRIDIEKGVYSPFTFPFGLLQTKGSKRWFVIASTSGPLLISLTLIFGHSLGKYSPEGANLWTSACGYVGVLLSVYALRCALGEYAWIRRWEKETGRKMYISYVVDWRRFKEEEKKRNHAERARLNASKN